MKIDFIIGSQRSGGAERVVASLANYFAEHGHDVRIITFIDGDKYELNEKIVRLRFHKSLLIANFALTRATFFLCRFYKSKKNRPDIISSHIHNMGLATIPISRLFGIKIVVSEHFNHKVKIDFKRWVLWNFLYKFPDAVTVLTSYDKPFFDKRNKNVVVMNNPGSFNPVITKTTKINNKTILAIGSLDRYLHKGFDNLIDIAYELKKKKSDWKIKIVGEGEYGMKFLKKKIEELNLQNYVFLLGYRSDVNEIMKSSEIFILTSRHEGLPMVLIEAASQGMACIAYDCISGPSEIIEDGISGVLVKNQDKKEMMSKIIALIDDKNFRDKIGYNAAISSSKFSLERIGGMWQALFDEILKK